jgi:thioesterase domain-containing protein
LFCLPPATGSSACYTPLRHHLDADRPIYGLEQGEPPATFAEGVTAALDQIRRVQPAGPYHLLGWSFGGLLAHAIATRLAGDGEKVALLAVLDAYPNDRRRLSDPRLLGDVTAIRNRELAAAYTPGRFDGDLLLFRAVHSGPFGSWAHYVSGHVEAHDVQCGHFDMMEPDALGAIGAVLGRALAC